MYYTFIFMCNKQMLLDALNFLLGLIKNLYIYEAFTD